jgi:aminoglycoside phosphotransferase (APT) family kinase protein
MTEPDPRCLPLVEVAPDQIRALLSPGLGSAITGVERIEGGLVNTAYKITLAGSGASFCLRIFAAGQIAWERERNILERISASLPVPRVVLADFGGPAFAHPYLVYEWIEGMTLNEYRRRMPREALLSVAEPLGRLLARMATLSFSGELDIHHPDSSWVEELLAVNEERLRRGPAGDRLGRTLADALRRLLDRSAAHLGRPDIAVCLVHGDFGGRNILVAPGGHRSWRVSGLLDWEASFSGSMLWDLGSLFRYGGRYSESFRRCLERAFGEAGGELPRDWYRLARLLDATRLVETLNEIREMPVVFGECTELIEALVTAGL